eukprot:31330-Pelagococcus_subviridis.AAC.6
MMRKRMLRPRATPASSVAVQRARAVAAATPRRAERDEPLLWERRGGVERRQMELKGAEGGA